MRSSVGRTATVHMMGNAEVMADFEVGDSAAKGGLKGGDANLDDRYGSPGAAARRAHRDAI